MHAKWKRNAVVATMAILVCAAVGLNWKYSNSQPEAEEADGGKILGEATLVSGEEHVEANAKKPAGAEKADAVSKDSKDSKESTESAEDYFASARLSRQQARDSALSLLQEAAAQENAGQSAVDEASEGIQVLAGYTLKESQIENLVTAKGYTDCVAFMDEDSVSVVVSTPNGELTDGDVTKIKDITMTETGYDASGIKIMAAN